MVIVDQSIIDIHWYHLHGVIWDRWWCLRWN